MFEKEAEESFMCKKVLYKWETDKRSYIDGFKDGYNKANEWHYVKDGDLPKDNKEYLVLYYFNYRGKKEMHCGVRDNLHNDFETNRCYTEQIIAWKEIVLPELPKESE